MIILILQLKTLRHLPQVSKRQIIGLDLYRQPFIAKQLFYGGKIRLETSDQRTPQMAV